ncbi:hypothetical protein MJG53_006112 [Ovis ammon polii x Ovis aries]|uniref:Uncharacterized protein n=1 Tax=Ovis ammon polii x Ovis aries TaxID=2918886 RepID=A0ACB9V8C9_9CETA|nr:hypothetical protein MJT46_005679 [Ovis ammon polii x Ovis aries]KAI4585878.1 hypothetical protein MJG53_006112 [Ovis ammon polii x Ovis aries]
MSSILTCSLKVCFLFCPIRIITAAVSYFIPSNGDKYTAYKNLNYERIYNKRSAVRPRERSGWLCDFSPGTVISLFSYLWKGTCSGCGRSFSVLEIRVEKEVRHDFDFPFHHWIVPPFSTAAQCSLRLALGQHQLHLGDLQIQQKQSQDGF